jgi:hypothetical protein
VRTAPRAFTGRTVLAFLFLAVPLLCLLAAPASAATAPIDRRITDARITESSGLAPSLWYPGVVWTHNDSGNPPKIYAIARNGSTRATLTLLDEPDVDWEAIASLRVPVGSGAPAGPLIAVGDIGDNNGVHPHVRIAIIKEPSELRSTSVRPIRVLRLRYPGGPQDAESLLADPRTGRFYIVSKTLFGADLYAVPPKLWPGTAGSSPARVSTVTTLTRLATIPANFVTDGAFLPDGRMLVRGYGRVYLLDRPESVHHGRLAVLASAGLPDQHQGESMAVVDSGKHALIGSEGAREPVYRIALPTVPAGAGSASVTLPTGTSSGESQGAGQASASSTSHGKPGSAATAGPELTGLGSIRIWAAVVGTGLVLMGITGGVVMYLTRLR